MNTVQFEDRKIQLGDSLRCSPRVTAKMAPGIFWPEVIIQCRMEAEPVKVAWTRRSMPTVRELRNFTMRELTY